ncbi:MAG: hypothetical protein PVJ55_01875 [Anaerolineae bacterium]|jgi:hypothetical protein
MRKRLIQMFTLLALILGLALGPAMVTKAAPASQPGSTVSPCALDHGGSGG